MKDLKISNGSRETISKVLTRTNVAIDSGEEYSGARKRGSYIYLIVHFSLARIDSAIDTSLLAMAAIIHIFI